MSNLVNHARFELELLGEDEATISDYLKVIQAFADAGHSGGSAACAIPIINRLLQFQNIMPLTNDPSEWNRVGEEMWQNRRRPDAFSRDGGKSYYLLDDKKKIFGLINSNRFGKRKIYIPESR